jgi:hypothetical protein
MLHRTPGLVRSFAVSLAAGAAACGTVLDAEQTPGRGLLDEGRVDVRLDGSSDCNTLAGHRLDRYVAEPRAGSELNLVGIYEAPAAPGAGAGRFEIEVHRKAPMVLVLSAHEATAWVVRAGDGAQLEEVIVTGYHAQSAEVPAGVPLTVRSYATDGAFFGNAYMWPHAGEACADFFPPATCDELGDAWQAELGFHIESASKLVDSVELWSGLALTSFHGCREMSQLTLEDDQPLLVTGAGAAATSR